MEKIKKTGIVFAVVMLIGVLIAIADANYLLGGRLIGVFAVSSFVGSFAYYMLSKEK